MDDDITPRAGGPLRVGDAERDRAAAALGEHFSAGRLDRAEFDARMNAALAARTEADLAALFTDLPSEGKSAQPRSAGQPRPMRCTSLLYMLIPIALAATVLAVVHGFPPFFLIPLFFWLRRRRGPARRMMRRTGPSHY